MASDVGRPVALVLVAALAPILLVLAPRDRAAVIVLAASATQAAEAVSRADGAILARFGEFGLVAVSDQPGFAGRLYGTGALLVIDAAGRGGCLSLSRTS